MLSFSSTDLARRSTYICLSCSGSIRPPRGRLSPASPGLHGRHGAHQRKHSSSKTSNASKSEPRPPTNPAKVSPDASAEEAKPTPSSTSGRIHAPHTGGSKTGQPVVDEQKPFVNLPQVPSTQSIQPLNIQLAAFFSLHRPISVSHAFPPPTTSELFSTLFEPGRRKTKPQSGEVIQTLSQAVERLDRAVAAHEGQDNQSRLTQGEATALKPQKTREPASSSDMDLQGSNPYLPYLPPPPPQPMPEWSRSGKKGLGNRPAYPTEPSLADFQNAISGTATPSHLARSLSAPPLSPAAGGVSLPSTTPTDPNFPPNFFHTRPIPIRIPIILPFRSRMRERMSEHEHRRWQRRWQQQQQHQEEEEGGEEGIEQGQSHDRETGGRRRTTTERVVYHAISVRRQRKLKMKKHKYKKLLKRTRNLRKKIEKGR